MEQEFGVYVITINSQAIIVGYTSHSFDYAFNMYKRKLNSPKVKGVSINYLKACYNRGAVMKLLPIIRYKVGEKVSEIKLREEKYHAIKKYKPKFMN